MTFARVLPFLLLTAPLTWGQTPAPKLDGLWGTDRIFGPVAEGQLTIRRNGAIWSADIGSYSTSVLVKGHDVTLQLANVAGDFHGRLLPGEASIEGHWIGPKNTVNVARFGSPLTLQRIGPNAWRGVVHPLEDRLSLYLVVRENSKGGLEAFFRNPERNLQFGQVYQLALNGSELELKGTDHFEGTYDAKADRITLLWPAYGVHLDFTRRGRDQADGFYPRDSAHSKYVYAPPAAENDGWTSGSLTDVGMDPKPVSALVQHIVDTNPFEPGAQLVHSLLIIRHGKLVLEEYFHGFSRERPHDLRSAPKSFSSLLIGIALDHHAPFDVSTPVYSLFPEYKTFANPDPRKHDMKVENLLTMTSGFACNDSDPTSPGREGLMYTQTEQPDWYKYTLDQPQAYAPGEKMQYCTAGVNLLGGILRNTTKESTLEFIHRELAVPLQMRDYYLNLTPSFEAFMGGGHFFRARDTAKIGQLYLAGGVWNGKRVISKQWIDRSVAYHSRSSPIATYGYNWWRREIKRGDRVYQEYEAAGNGGQIVIVIPELDLVVLFYAGHYSSPTSNKLRDELVPQYIIPAVLN